MDKKTLEKSLQKIKREGEKLTKLENEDLTYLREKIKKSFDREKWFALVQEISERNLGLRHYDTQLMAGLLLDEGKVVEMKTGEGKTLASTLSVSFNALQKKGVHVITVNDYLAERDAKWMGKLYANLGLTTGLVLPNQNIPEKQKNYNQDITYVTNSTVVFDYLKDNLVVTTNKLSQRSLFYCLIDEIDSVLIDEARVPLIISESVKISSSVSIELTRARNIAEKLEENVDFEVDKKKKEISLTEKGYERIQAFFSQSGRISGENTEILLILNAIRVNYFYLRDIDYLVTNKKIILIDESTGRPMADRRWSFGIQEAIEAKEGIFSPIRSTTLSSITYQSFFPEYQKISGMTGTAVSSKEEFRNTYQLEVLSIAPFKKLLRKDFSDEVYGNLQNKWQGVLSKGKEAFLQGQPMLIGTSSIENSDFLSDIFAYSGLPHTLLNARPQNATLESKIIAQAGQLYSLTIATNMAGRGTDILLGGNLEFRIKESIFELLEETNKKVTAVSTEKRSKKDRKKRILPETKKLTWKKILAKLTTNLLEKYQENFLDLLSQVENLPYSLKESNFSLKLLYSYLQKEFLPTWKKQKEAVKATGGLFVIGTERSENLRIDDQLRGRAGRQGDPGISQFLISLDDTLFRRYSTQNLKQFFSQNSSLPLQSSFINYALRNIQKKIENINYETRRNLLTYNELENFERKLVFDLRYRLLTKNAQYSLSLFFKQFFLRGLWEKKVFPFSFSPVFLFSFSSCCFFSSESENLPKTKLLFITHDFAFSDLQKYKVKRKNRLFFSLIDNLWAEHLRKNNFFRESLRWRSYAQKDPVDEFNFESFKAYNELFLYFGLAFIYYIQLEEYQLDISDMI